MKIELEINPPDSKYCFHKEDTNSACKFSCYSHFRREFCKIYDKIIIEGKRIEECLKAEQK